MRSGALPIATTPAGVRSAVSLGRQRLLYAIRPREGGIFCAVRAREGYRPRLLTDKVLEIAETPLVAEKRVQKADGSVEIPRLTR